MEKNYTWNSMPTAAEDEEKNARIDDIIMDLKAEIPLNKNSEHNIRLQKPTFHNTVSCNPIPSYPNAINSDPPSLQNHDLQNPRNASTPSSMPKQRGRPLKAADSRTDRTTLNKRNYARSYNQKQKQKRQMALFAMNVLLTAMKETENGNPQFHGFVNLVLHRLSPEVKYELQNHV